MPGPTELKDNGPAGVGHALSWSTSVYSTWMLRALNGVVGIPTWWMEVYTWFVTKIGSLLKLHCLRQMLAASMLGYEEGTCSEMLQHLKRLYENCTKMVALIMRRSMALWQETAYMDKTSELNGEKKMDVVCDLQAINIGWAETSDVIWCAEKATFTIWIFDGRKREDMGTGKGKEGMWKV